MRTCSKCRVEKPLGEFYSDANKSMGKSYLCVPCSKAKRREEWLNWAYGITTEDYNQMFLDQEGCCAICKRHQKEFKKRFAVDHCHTTGEVRSLLCGKCNRQLSVIENDMYQKYLEYLRKHNSPFINN